MRFDVDTRPNGVSSITGDVLTEAMPWIKHVTGQTIVIKYGGAAMVDADLRAKVMADIVLLKIIGVNPVIVHGGGKAISAAMEREGIEVKFVGGQRVTTDEAMAVVRRVLTGEVNQELVEAMNQHGNMAVGISGADAGVLVADAASPELGRVGRITRTNPALVEDLVAADYIPIIASIAIGEDGGCYNVNADVAAGCLAAAIGAHKVIFLSDIDGFYANWPDEASLVSAMTLEEARAIVDEGENQGGMIPKLASCVHALEEGVSRAHIVNGTTPHALLLEMLTNQGIGTMVTGRKAPAGFDPAPLGNFATKLITD
ncbi:MAG: acetylglutamate kinase [Eggerthellaceae bacterium]|nr:acetylglutamate kinase [Eggerthellaceae bacterium]